MLLNDISKFTYRPIDFRYNVKAEDFWKYKIDVTKVETITAEIAEKFFDTNQDVDKINVHQIGKNKVFTASSFYNALTIRRTNHILKKTFCFRTFSKDEETKQLLNLIKTEQKHSYIFRTDIKSFFKSLPFQLIINDLYQKNFITNTVYSHLNNICKNLTEQGFKGLPRGLPISSSLSEYALLEFDRTIRNIDSCLYYSRYVDDIVVLTANPVDNLEEMITNHLPYKLTLNKSKTSCKEIGINDYIDFLGYSFNLKDVNQTKISLRKINKIKKRISLTFRSFVKCDSDFDLLLDRLRFLSANSKLKMAGRKKAILVGIRYQYQLCSEEEIRKQLIGLDTFYKKILYSKKYYISKQLTSKLSSDKINILRGISFTAGYFKNLTYCYGRERVSRIKDSWRYE